ncbi:hypothetical protein [Streptomyces sp. NPDC089919]|uniref:hypothetical protein n=1 Tax=Streptomyces sp. NPDC089919 TaxID=3155188 RepID=UPI003436D41A
MPAAERDELPRIPRRTTATGPSVRDLLASCAAATAVSTPPPTTARRHESEDDPTPAPPEAA